MNKNFKCKRCKCEPEELIAYSDFNKKMDDFNWYCHPCFDKYIDKEKIKEPPKKEVQYNNEIFSSIEQNQASNMI